MVWKVGKFKFNLVFKAGCLDFCALFVRVVRLFLSRFFFGGALFRVLKCLLIGIIGLKGVWGFSF